MSYRAVTIDELPALKRLLRRLQEPFRVADIMPLLPEGMKDLEPRELGRALLSRELCEQVGTDRPTRSALLIRRRERHDTERKPGRDGDMKCHTLNCTEEAQPGSTYCEYCKPSRISASVEEAQVRVARAQEERDRLHERVRDEYGALHEVDTRAKGGDSRARTLRSLYDKAVRELRLAKSDLERQRNEVRQAEERPAPSEPSAPIEAEVELKATEEGIEISGLPPELQDLESGTGKVTEILPNGDAVVEIDLGPEVPASTAYDGLLQRYKAICDRIEAFPPTYGNPTKEEKALKKERLQLRKDLKALAPLKTCWFCCSFSINNYERPCRSGILDAGAVPTDACRIWELASGQGYLDDDCTVAMSEFRAEQAAKMTQEEVPPEVVEIDDCVGCVRHGHSDPEECRTCEPDGDEAGNPTHYEPAPGKQPYWEGGPLDTVNGMPWHVAVAKCPVGEVVKLKPGVYTFDSGKGFQSGLHLDLPYQVYGPITPGEALTQIYQQRRSDEADEVTITVNGEPATKSGLMQHIADKIEEAEQENERRKATKQVDLEGNDLKLPLGVKETKKVSRSRTYEIENYKLTVKEDDLLQFNHWLPDRKRTYVAIKLRFTPADEETIYNEYDYDEAASDMIAILNKASFILAVEREREAILMKHLAEMI